MSALLSGGEVISIHCGGAGANLGVTEWQLLAKEHHLLTCQHLHKAFRESNDQPFGTEPPQTSLVSQNLGPFFAETANRYVPRALFVDTDPSMRFSGIFDAASPLRHFFRPENAIFSGQTSGGLRSKAIAIFEEGVLQKYSSALTKEVELCDGLQAFSFSNHLGGGAGAGLTSLLMQQIRDELGAKVSLLSSTIFPTLLDFGGRNHAVELYNTVLTMPDLSELSDLTFLIDNEALYDICFRLVSIAEPGWRDLNHIAVAANTTFTSCMRFPSLHHSKPAVSRLFMSELANALTLPNLPFAVPGFAPLTHRGANAPLGALLATDALLSGEDDRKATNLHYRKSGTRMPSVAELSQCLFRPSNLFTAIDPLGHHYLKALVVVRGAIEPGEISQEINFARLNGPDRFRQWGQWLPREFLLKICPHAQYQLQLSAAFAGNSTTIGERMLQLMTKSYELFQKRAFLHRFVEAGAEIEEFDQKYEACRVLIDLYTDHFHNAHNKQLKKYETKRDLGQIPFRWNLLKHKDFIFDTHKAIQIDT